MRTFKVGDKAIVSDKGLFHGCLLEITEIDGLFPICGTITAPVDTDIVNTYALSNGTPYHQLIVAAGKTLTRVCFDIEDISPLGAS